MSDQTTVKRFTFNPTLTMGDIVTAGTILLGGAAAYYSLSTRVSVLEEKAQSSYLQASVDRQDQKETIRTIRDDIKDIQRSMNALMLAVGNGSKR